jgi:hypothetical protein
MGLISVRAEVAADLLAAAWRTPPSVRGTRRVQASAGGAMGWAELPGWRGSLELPFARRSVIAPAEGHEPCGGEDHEHGRECDEPR